MRTKYTVQQQIENFKSKNIQFNIVDEEYATQYLNDNTYYFKLKSFAKAFEYNETKKQYINLDFAYLVELSKLDMYLREYIIKSSLDTEHFLKVKFLRDLTNNDLEDGYNIVDLFFIKYPYISQNISLKKKDSACADLIHKYENNWAAWNIIEVLSFGDFVKLFQLYYDLYPDTKSKTIINLLWPLKFIRNASAHNNCLLNTLRKPYLHTHLFNNKKNTIEPNKELVSLLTKVPNVSKNTRKKKIANPIIHDFIASLFLFNEVCSSQTLKEKQFNNLTNLLNERFCRHKDYFINDNVFMSNYEFVKKVVDYLSGKCI